MASRRSFNWDTVVENIKSAEAPKRYNDEDKKNFYSPKLDETGNATAIIRFLPPHPEESTPFVKLYNHGFKDINGWYIENCPSTNNDPCPVCKYNAQMWDSGNEEEGRKRKRKLSYFTNILVIRDPNQPEAEGKVFKYRYGLKIHEKIMEKLNPKDPDIDEKVIVFDYNKGANFKLKVKTVSDGRGGSFPNYDSSVFAEVSPISLGGKELTDEQITELESTMHKLEPIIAKNSFKTYEDLAQRFTEKSGIAVGDRSSVPTGNTRAKTKNVEEEETPTTQKVHEETPVANDESDEDFFARLAQQ